MRPEYKINCPSKPPAKSSNAQFFKKIKFMEFLKCEEPKNKHTKDIYKKKIINFINRH